VFLRPQSKGNSPMDANARFEFEFEFEARRAMREWLMV
jgi:hypothetical protein